MGKSWVQPQPKGAALAPKGLESHHHPRTPSCRELYLHRELLRVLW